MRPSISSRPRRSSRPRPDIAGFTSGPTLVSITEPSELALLYSDNPLKTVITAIYNTKDRMPKSARTYSIFTVNSLPKLIDVVREKYHAAIEKADEENEILSDDHLQTLRSIRYLLTKKYELLFAEEGREPAHHTMTGQTQKPDSAPCRCAGNLFFNEDFTQIALVNNKSGDFRPQAVLLKNVLAVLVVLHKHKKDEHKKGPISLEETFQIKHQETRTTYTVSISVLDEFIQKTFNQEQLQQFVEVNVEAEKREVHYQPRQAPTQTAEKRKVHYQPRQTPTQTTVPTARPHHGLRRRTLLFPSPPPTPKESSSEPLLPLPPVEEKTSLRDRLINETLFGSIKRKGIESDGAKGDTPKPPTKRVKICQSNAERLAASTLLLRCT